MAGKNSDVLKAQVREAAENDLETFIRLVHPNRVLGAIHSEIISWWQREEASTHQVLLLPRDHQKSALVAYRVAHAIVKRPDIRILYLSATSNLAVKQLKFIKDILTSKVVQFYWPDLIHPDEGKREKWTETEISVDHPKRAQENVRDPTIFTAGLTTTITGMHCDITVFDDVVVRENAYTEEGRSKVEQQYSLLASIESTDALEWIVGTRYHPKDLYNALAEMVVPTFNEDGEETGSYALYEIFQRQVETNGEFLWPRQQRPDGKWFGFNRAVLEKKRAQYLDQSQFRAQYYNDPNDPSEAGIQREHFQYYDRRFLHRVAGQWFLKDRRINIFASVDFAYSIKARADSTAIVVVGVDSSHNYYVLDIDRFKSDKVSDYFDHILRLHQKWDFRKIRAECTAAQQTIITTLKNDYIRRHGLALTIEDHRPTRHDGNKEERIAAALQPRYHNGQMWHYQGGNCQLLEDELLLAKAPHDDIKDALAAVIDSCIAPSPPSAGGLSAPKRFAPHPRFGGVA